MSSDAPFASALSGWVRRAGAAPLVTDLRADGGRIELSGRSLDNAATKALNLFADDLGLQPGARIGLLADPGWQCATVLVGAWWAGLTVEVPTAAARAPFPVVVVDPAHVAAGRTVADEVLVMSDDAWGLPLGDRTPAGTQDLSALLRVQPDAPMVEPGQPPQEWLVVGGQRLNAGAVARSARELAVRWQLPAGGRLATSLATTTVEGLLALVAVPVVRGASVVVIDAAMSAPARARHAAAERITSTAIARESHTLE